MKISTLTTHFLTGVFILATSSAFSAENNTRNLQSYKQTGQTGLVAYTNGQTGAQVGNQFKSNSEVPYNLKTEADKTDVLMVPLDNSEPEDFHEMNQMYYDQKGVSPSSPAPFPTGTAPVDYSKIRK